jgi:NADPH:quinone reductase-like Zn-dependent oxidoreductase
MSRFVQYSENGGPEVLNVIEVDEPTPGAGQVRIKVEAAGLNPVDFKIFRGYIPGGYGAVLPAGVGNDYAGTIDAIGEGVNDFAVGDAVFGGARHFAVADYVVVDTSTLSRRPDGLSIEIAGALDIAGRTAVASVRSVNLTEDDTVLISAAAGGVGVIASQLAVRAGATVIGTVGPDNVDFVRGLGVIPVVYGDGLVDRIRAAAPQGITAVLDNHGPDTIAVALELGVPVGRINTIAAHAEIAKYSIGGVGGAEASIADRDQLAAQIAAGDVVVPIEATYPLTEVREAYERLEQGHLRGKIVVIP